MSAPSAVRAAASVTVRDTSLPVCANSEPHELGVASENDHDVTAPAANTNPSAGTADTVTTPSTHAPVEYTTPTIDAETTEPSQVWCRILLS